VLLNKCKTVVYLSVPTRSLTTTSNMDYQKLLRSALGIAYQAAYVIEDIRVSGDWSKAPKEDGSPLTEADMRANEVIEDGLGNLTGEIPILSEEGVDKSSHVGVPTFWVVDPLDGTKEFVAGRPEYTVNIALVVMGVPVLGVVVCPPTKEAWYGAEGVGAFHKASQYSSPSETRTLPKPSPGETLKATVSRSHANDQTNALLASLFPQNPQVDMTATGSSIKIAWVAQGLVHVYLRNAPTNEWDTAAADAVLRVAGGTIHQFDSENCKPGDLLVYGKPDTTLNPHFLCVSWKE
jgi:3'(2'), 5'-bisphosphate nucleotidase